VSNKVENCVYLDVQISEFSFGWVFGKGLWIRFEHKDERSLQVKDKEGQDPGKKVEEGDIIQLLCTDYKIMSNILKSMLK